MVRDQRSEVQNRKEEEIGSGCPVEDDVVYAQSDKHNQMSLELFRTLLPVLETSRILTTWTTRYSWYSSTERKIFRLKHKRL